MENKLPRITFIDRNGKSLKELKNQFTGIKGFEFVEGDFGQTMQSNSSINCIVSPANSFGLMDGGLDFFINRYLFPVNDKEISYYVKQRILDEFSGEQPVGTSILVPAKSVDNRVFLLAHTPTMRVPTDVSNTENAYLAFKALLNVIYNFNKNTKGRFKIMNVACSSFCTGAGYMPADKAAKQMKLAYTHFMEGKQMIKENINWEYAERINQEIISIGD